MEARIHYFDSPGKQNTEKTLDLAVERAIERGITHIVVASSTGRTGVMLGERAVPKGIIPIVVTYHYGFSKRGQWSMRETNLRKLDAMGVRVVSMSHALSGVERSITKKLGGTSRVEVISAALRSLFGEGLKVCVEIAMMAADCGALPCDEGSGAITVGGTSVGADTAVLLSPSHCSSFFDLNIREIIAMPRGR